MLNFIAEKVVEILLRVLDLQVRMDRLETTTATIKADTEEILRLLTTPPEPPRPVAVTAIVGSPEEDPEDA